VFQEDTTVFYQEHLEEKGDRYISYEVKNWPFVIKDILKTTIEELEKPEALGS
jgi:hypothetical protein